VVALDGAQLPAEHALAGEPGGDGEEERSRISERVVALDGAQLDGDAHGLAGDVEEDHGEEGVPEASAAQLHLDAAGEHGAAQRGGTMPGCAPPPPVPSAPARRSS
jgi:hypothetical protein